MVDIKPRSIPTALFNTAATGTRQFVVQDAFEITVSEAFRVPSFTP